jgi:hypothetical protein
VDIESPDLSAENNSGYQFGGFYRKGGFLYGQVGLDFQQYKMELLSDSESGQVNLKRVQLPLYAGLNLLNFSKRVVNLRAYAGPVVGYHYGYKIDNPDFTSNDFRRGYVNGTIGGGLDILIFSLDAGYTFGLSDVFAGELEAKGSYAFVNVGVTF